MPPGSPDRREHDSAPLFATIEEFESAPVGLCVRGESFQVWCVDDSLCISSVWGRPTLDHLRDVLRLADVAFHPSMRAPFATMIDLRGLLSVEIAGFHRLAEYVRARPELKHRVRRQAILRPDGFIGVLTAGFLPVFDEVFPARVFTDPVPGLDWLGRADTPEVAIELARRLERARDLHPQVTDLRRLLDGDPTGLELAAAARALGTSRRSLQRQLALAGTTFGHELSAARVRLAQRLLLESDRKITSIAIEVGCASLQHLGLLFRKHVGASPSEWRKLPR